MRIISIGTLKALWEQPARRDAEQPLRAWVKVVHGAGWPNPPAVKRMFDSADVLRNGRIWFDIGGNKYRLVAWARHHYGVVYVRCIGTHRAHDAIDPQTI
jgi:mRNA interferase HigB